MKQHFRDMLGKISAFLSRWSVRILKAIKRDIKKHPLISGATLLIWFKLFILFIQLNESAFASVYYTTQLCVIIYIALTYIVDLIRDRKQKWYFRKGVVLILLLLAPPLGITLLWAGSSFKKNPKIALTVIFSLFFAGQLLLQLPDKMETVFIDAVDEDKRDLKSILQSDLDPSQKEDLTTPQLAKYYSNSVVLIESFNRTGKKLSMGSGFVVSKTGAIITNHHNIESAVKIEVRFPSGKSYDSSSLIFKDPSVDIAVIKIDIEGDDITPIIIGDSDHLIIGEKVIAIGNPQGFQSTISDGIISGIREINGLVLLQITVPLSPGSSGGVLLNSKGEAVGITSYSLSDISQNLNFAIPINVLKSLVEKMEL